MKRTVEEIYKTTKNPLDHGIYFEGWRVRKIEKLPIGGRFRLRDEYHHEIATVKTGTLLDFDK